LAPAERRLYRPVRSDESPREKALNHAAIAAKNMGGSAKNQFGGKGGVIVISAKALAA
jgi:hypothetical protein